MTNNQALGYGLLALDKALANVSFLLTLEEQAEMAKEFARQIKYLFDTKTEDEAEEQGMTFLMD